MLFRSWRFAEHGRDGFLKQVAVNAFHIIAVQQAQSFQAVSYTHLGGAIRDPLSGRSYVYQAMRVTGAGDPLKPVSETLPGKLPQRKLVTTAAAGYSSYGNQIGLATGQVDEIYPVSYTHLSRWCAKFLTSTATPPS